MIKIIIRKRFKMERYKALGLKLTPQRMAILNYLDGNKEHPSAETIYKALKKRFPTMSFATVYNTLENLKKIGYLVELNLDPQKKHFDPDTKPHHHFICEKCNKIFDIYHEIPLPISKIEEEGFQIKKTHIQFFGTCPKCKKIS